MVTLNLNSTQLSCRTVLGLPPYYYVSRFMPIMFPDEGNELIWFDEIMSLFPGVEHEDISIGF